MSSLVKVEGLPKRTAVAIQQRASMIRCSPLTTLRLVLFPNMFLPYIIYLLQEHFDLQKKRFSKCDLGVSIFILIRGNHFSLRTQVDYNSWMIRTNKTNKNTNYGKLHSYNYRNALYQGEISPQNSSRQGQGLIYVTDSHHFIASSRFSNNQLSGHSFFYHSHAQYQYGNWLGNRAHGIAVLRMSEVLIVAQYKNGELRNGSKMVYVFERYNTGVIVQKIADGQWIIAKKQEIFCKDELQGLIAQCRFSSEQIPYLLIKYLNSYMVAVNSPIKLRLLNNMYYRFGCDQGLAIIFDDQYHIASVGVHSKSNLTSFGVKYNSAQLGNQVQEGIFEGNKTFVFEELRRPVYKIGKLYCKEHLSGVNFKNQIFKDPSQKYFQYHRDLLQSDFITSMFEDIVLTCREQSIKQIIQRDPNTRSQRKQFGQFQVATFKEPARSPQRQRGPPQKSAQRSPSQESRRGEMTGELIETLKGNTHWGVETFQFQKLSERNRLQIIKKELYVNLAQIPKEKKREREVASSSRKVGIITMSPVDIGNVSNRDRYDSSHKRDIYIHEVPKQWKEQQTPNLDKHANIKINSEKNQGVERKSKLRRKIFQQNTNIRRDYSPDAQMSPSPFKSKIKSRIFSNTFTPEKQSRSKSRNSRRIFTNSKTPEKRGGLNQKSGGFRTVEVINESVLPSPHRQLESSLLKSQSDSYIPNYPITLTKQVKEQRKVEEQYKLAAVRQGEISEEMVECVQQRAIQRMRRVAKSQSTSKKQVKDEYPKRNNVVYRNNMKDQHKDYLFQPIQIKQSGNSPYIINRANLSYNPSAKTLNYQLSKKSIQSSNPLNYQLSKKSIQSSNPLKKQKMKSYMDPSPYQFNHAERMSQFKRKVNYF